MVSTSNGRGMLIMEMVGLPVRGDGRIGHWRAARVHGRMCRYLAGRAFPLDIVGRTATRLLGADPSLREDMERMRCVFRDAVAGRCGVEWN